MKPKRPGVVYGYLIKFYKCPYCGQCFSTYDIKAHIKNCFRHHREQVKKVCSERGKRNFKEGKILKHIPRKDENSEQGT